MKSFRTRLPAAPLLLLAVGAALVACSSPSEPSPSATYSTDLNALDPATAAYLSENAKALASQLGVSDPPEVDPVRLITLDEWATVQVQCLNEEGFDAQISADGAGISYPKLDPSLADSLNAAIYTCEVRYPTQLKYMAPLSQEALKRLHEYRKSTLIECMSELGYQPSSEAPSLNVFLENGGQWSPFEGLELTGSAEGELNSACPQTPDDVYGK